MIRRKTVSACFNTQPPEGGWATKLAEQLGMAGFNTQPPEGGWVSNPLRKAD